MTKCQPLRGARGVVGSCSWRTRRFTLALVAALPVKFCRRCCRELAIRVPAALPVHLRHRVAAAKGITGIKPLGEQGRESDREQKVGKRTDENSPDWARTRGFRLALDSRSLGVVMGVIFAFSWLAQSIAGRSAFNEQQLSQLQDPVSWPGYVVSSDFWNRTLQNWQSEFLAVGSMVVLSIYLRQRGSPESKPVGTSHTATGIEG